MKRRRSGRGKEYQTNAQEERANAEHRVIMPLLLKALEAFEHERVRNEGSSHPLSSWIDTNGTCNELPERLAQNDDPKEEFVDWVALEKMKSCVKPKFCKLDGESDEQGALRFASVTSKCVRWVDLFGKVHRNDDDVTVTCQAYQCLISMPPKSGFILSDIARLDPLLKGPMSHPFSHAEKQKGRC